ncbi:MULTISPECIES: ketopantoate reductase family protein [Burkholderia]|uniref:ketopantoate reductase family protein n=1 Tax=Burkholderia TaxID=32008 RepID=UPI000754B626|nr:MULTISPECIES: 2-dehydropantoate 2-reductase [Burkholderia]AOJ28626.1 2-dehydropantoate 2-reductase [Burkholderia seminalis]KVF52657.1 2-dehydropantoate 2-reductase [Burkholderia seminalis]MBN3738825.1 2-dehydropantoate 2-reductase [Burkholderia sp. Tr-20355]MCA8040362.1 2-dehydropantoate 2-reductase [Burkholderia seminalis]MCA8423607.1 2-dehydropantoate 2-reductase [Burkholderia seminalis]
MERKEEQGRRGGNPSGTKICVAGAGAIGSTLAARLAASGRAVSVFARGATLGAIRRRGIELDDLSGSIRVNVPASDRADDFDRQDIVFVCAKAHALPGLLTSIKPMLGKETVVVPAVNGVPWWYFGGEGGREHGSAGSGPDYESVRAVDPDGSLAAMLPSRQILGCVVYITAEVREPGRVVATNPHRMILGELDNRPSVRLEQVCALLSDAGIDTRASGRIRDDVWTKLVANLSSNPLSVITGGTLQDIYGAAELREVVVDMMGEVISVAERYGARIALNQDAFLVQGEKMGAFRTSMLQDYEKGQRLELAAIGDAVVELADRYGIPMPTTRAILALTRYRTTQRTLR